MWISLCSLQPVAVFWQFMDHSFTHKPWMWISLCSLQPVAVFWQFMDHSFTHKPWMWISLCSLQPVAVFWQFMDHSFTHKPWMWISLCSLQPVAVFCIVCLFFMDQLNFAIISHPRKKYLEIGICMWYISKQQNVEYVISLLVKVKLG